MPTSRKTRGSAIVEFRRCRCGATPAIAEKDITGEGMSYAVHCSKFCGDDSHWQMSLTEAIKRWNAGLVRGASGGNGSAPDDQQQPLQ
jgi:hypothetical protein